MGIMYNKWRLPGSRFAFVLRTVLRKHLCTCMYSPGGEIAGRRADIKKFLHDTFKPVVGANMLPMPGENIPARLRETGKMVAMLINCASLPLSGHERSFPFLLPNLAVSEVVAAIFSRYLVLFARGTGCGYPCRR